MELTLVGKSPVKNENPVGIDIKYDPEFDELQTEISKAYSVHQNESADWLKITTLSAGILSQKSKDLIVASYLSIGLIHSQKVDGFFLGVNIYLDLLENYWKDLYPSISRPRGRRQAIVWWVEKLAQALKGLGLLSHLPQDKKNALVQRLKNAQKFLDENLEDAPSFRPILDEVETRVISEIPDDIKTDSTRNQETEKKEILNEDVALRSQDDVKKSIQFLQGQSKKITAFLTTQNLSDPLIYRLNRFSLWIGIDELPPSNEKITFLPAPERHLIDQIADLMRDQKYEALLILAEASIFQYLFWFDLHFVVSECLRNLGQDYSKAYGSIIQDLSAFIKRFPGIHELKFSNGMPFADSETSLWIETFLKGVDSNKVADSTGAISSFDLRLGEDKKKWAQLLKAKKTSEVVKEFQDQIRLFSSQKEIVLYRLEFSEVLSKTKNPILTSAQIEILLNDVDRYRLEEFDPLLALRIFKNAIQLKRGDSESKSKVEALLARIGRIDLAELTKLS